MVLSSPFAPRFRRMFLLLVLLVVTATTPTSAWILRPALTGRQRHARSLSSLLQSTAATTASYMLDGKEIRGPITPLGNIVLVRVKDTLVASSGGILLPDQSKERPTEGIVVACGPGKLHPFTGKRITNPIREGMSVLYGKFDGRPVEYNGEECQVIRDDNVLLAYKGVTMKLETVVPIRDYVLIDLELDATDDDTLQTKSGVVVAAQVLKDDQPCQGRVVKVGEGRMASKGDFTESPVAIGDYVKFKDYAGNEVLIEGKTYSVVKMVDILATLSEDEDE